MLRVIVRLVADTALVAILLFVSAGTVLWWHAWVLLGVLLLVRVVGAISVYRVSPALVRERAGLPAGFDSFRWHALPRPAPVVAGLGLLLFALGWSIKSLLARVLRRCPVRCDSDLADGAALERRGALSPPGIVGLHGVRGARPVAIDPGHLVRRLTFDAAPLGAPLLVRSTRLSA